MSNQMCMRLRSDMTHQRVHESAERPGFAECKQRMPVIGHDSESAEINAVVSNRIFKRIDN